MPLGWSHTDANGFLLDNGGGSDRYAFVPTDDDGNPLNLPTSASLIAQLVDRADEVGVLVYASGDGNSAWRVGIEGGNVKIRKMTYSVLAAASATAAHGVSAGVPIKIEVRPGAVNGTTIEVYVNDSPTRLTFFDITASDSLAHLGGYGIDSAIDGARVASLNVAQLVPTYTARADIPWFVCGGEFWCSLDGVGLTLVDRRALNGAATLIDGDDLDQKVYLMDGANARVFDPVAQTVTKWIPTAGTLPGQTADGTTDSSILTQHIGRLYAAEEQNLIASAIDDALDWDTSVTSAGAAWEFATTFAGKIGQPIRAVLRLGKTTLLVGCSRSVWVVRGDPALAAVEIDTILDGVGVTGKDAMLRVSDDAALLHTTQGFYVVEGGATARPLSKLVLTSLINVDTVNTEYLVHLCRDVKRAGTLIFLTTKESGPSIHLFYDERTGKFLPPIAMGQPTGGGGGYFPEQYPDRIGPTCSMEFDGKVLMGGRDGYIYTFDDDAEDDDGEDIDSRMAMLVLHEEDLVAGIKLHSIDTMLADWSGAVTMSVYSGQTAEEAYQGTNRALRRRVTSSPARKCHTIDVSAPFLVIEVSGTGTAWGLEPMQASTSIDTLRRASWLPAPAPGLPCGVTVPEDSEPENGEGPGPGDPVGGGGSKCVACADWMAENTTGTVGGQPAYLIGTFTGTPGGVSTAAKIGLQMLVDADICDLGNVIDIVRYAVGSISGVLIGDDADFQASALPSQNWSIYFRCGDQP